MIVRYFVKRLGYSYHISSRQKNLGLYCRDCMWASCTVEFGYCVLPNGRTYSCRGTKTARCWGSFEGFPEKSPCEISVSLWILIESLLMKVVRKVTRIRGEDLENNLNLLLCLVGVRPAVVKEFLHCVAVLVSMISITSSNRHTGREMLVSQRNNF